MILNENSNPVKIPLIYGLVLAGGKSSRMGIDKANIIWHLKEQQYHMADILLPFCETVFISCKPGQASNLNQDYHILPDTVNGLGPFGAILSAFQNNSSCAWLVTACDLPMLNAETISNLIKHRDPNCMATTFRSPVDGLPEPLITIWEPRSYQVLQYFLSKDVSCPRKALMNNDVKILTAPDPIALSNVNTKEDARKVKDLLSQIKGHA